MSDIKSMKLYNNVERIFNELAALGISEDDPLTADDLTAFDQLHYHGTDALDIAIQQLKPASGSKILEIGSGIGGPSRYLATHSDAHITALELQKDQHVLAEKLSKRCQITENLAHICGDILDYDWQELRFDYIVSWLALYHIPERRRMLRHCYTLLNEGGQFYTDDLYLLEPLNTDEANELKSELYAITLPDITTYCQQIQEAGFEILMVENLSEDWRDFTHSRLIKFRADYQNHIRIHGETTVAALNVFYTAVDKYFQLGKLGGIRLCARKP